MAAGRLPAPGTALGPCLEPCPHKDCALTRQMAETPCRICQQLIGYQTSFYDERVRLVHEACLLHEVYPNDYPAPAVPGGHTMDPPPIP